MLLWLPAGLKQWLGWQRHRPAAATPPPWQPAAPPTVSPPLHTGIILSPTHPRAPACLISPCHLSPSLQVGCARDSAGCRATRRAGRQLVAGCHSAGAAHPRAALAQGQHPRQHACRWAAALQAPAAASPPLCIPQPDRGICRTSACTVWLGHMPAGVHGAAMHARHIAAPGGPAGSAHHASASHGMQATRGR